MTLVKEGSPIDRNQYPELSLRAKTIIKWAIHDYGKLLDAYSIVSDNIGHNLGLRISDEASLVISSNIIAGFAYSYTLTQDYSPLRPELAAWGESNTNAALGTFLQKELAHLSTDQKVIQMNIIDHITSIISDGYAEFDIERNPELKAARLVVVHEEAKKLAGIYRSNMHLQTAFPKGRDDGQEKDPRFFHFVAKRNPPQEVQAEIEDTIQQADKLVKGETKRNKFVALERFASEHTYITSFATGVLLIAGMFGINTTVSAFNQYINQHVSTAAGTPLPQNENMPKVSTTSAKDATPISNSSTRLELALEKLTDINGKPFRKIMTEFGYSVGPAIQNETHTGLVGDAGSFVRPAPIVEDPNLLFALRVPGYIDSIDAGTPVSWDGEIDIKSPHKTGKGRVIDRYGFILKYKNNQTIFIRLERFFEDGTSEPYVIRSGNQESTK